LSANKILIAALAMFIGLGIMASAGSILDDAERHLKEYKLEDIVLYDLTTDDAVNFDPTDYGLSILDAEYILNNLNNVYNLTLTQNGTDYELINNGTILDSNYDWYERNDGYELKYGVTRPFYYDILSSNYNMFIYLFSYTYNSQTIDLENDTVTYPITLTFEFQLESFTTLGRLTNVATITMTIAIISAATYFTLKGRAKAWLLKNKL